jgi:hypothetical protein
MPNSQETRKLFSLKYLRSQNLKPLVSNEGAIMPDMQVPYEATMFCLIGSQHCPGTGTFSVDKM